LGSDSSDRGFAGRDMQAVELGKSAQKEECLTARLGLSNFFSGTRFASGIRRFSTNRAASFHIYNHYPALVAASETLFRRSGKIDFARN